MNIAIDDLTNVLALGRQERQHPVWWANRLLLCIVSGVLLFSACRLVNNEEALLTAGREDA